MFVDGGRGTEDGFGFVDRNGRRFGKLTGAAARCSTAGEQQKNQHCGKAKSHPDSSRYCFNQPIMRVKPSGSSKNLVKPGKYIRRRDDREEIWIHKEFSEGAQYRAVLPTEENSLWIQRSSEGVSPNGLSGLKAGSTKNQ
jgi:hypothetical protein